MGREVGRRLKRERKYGYLWLIHVDVWQKPTQYYKAIILQLKINLKKTSNLSQKGVKDLKDILQRRQQAYKKMFNITTTR